MNDNGYSMTEYGLERRCLVISPFIIYTIIVSLIYILPYLKITIPYMISGLLMLGFLPIAMVKKGNWLNYIVLLLALTGIIFVLDFVIGNFTFTDSINEAIRNIRFFVPVVWAVYALEYCRPKRYGHFMIFFAAVTGIILIKTIGALEQDQWISRILAQGTTADTPEIRAYRLENIGGFEFSYMMGIVTLCIVWAAIKTKNKFARVVYVIAAIISYYYIIQTMYTTLLLLTAVGTVLLLVFNIKNLLIRIGIIVGFLILVTGAASLFETLSGMFGDSLLSTKFMQLHDALTGEGIDALGSRPQYLLQAVENWLHSPIIGGYRVGESTHSLFFTIIQKNGIVGLYAFGFVFYKSWKILSQKLKVLGVETLLLRIVFLYVLALSVLNPIGYVFEVTIMAFFVTPIWSVLVLREKEDD